MLNGSSPAEVPDACREVSVNDNLGAEKSTTSSCANDDLQAISGVTDDSGYVGTSDKSINSHVGGDSFIADDEPKDSQPADKVHVDDPRPTISTPNITDTGEDEQSSDVSCHEMKKHNVINDSASSTAMEDDDTVLVGSECDLEDDNTMSIASDISLTPNTSQKLLEVIVGDEEVNWCDAVIYRVDSFQHVKRNGVSLEVVERTKDGRFTHWNGILVVNECYEKTVAVRHSCDDWDTFEDTPAHWVETIQDGTLDRFQFCVKLLESKLTQWSWPCRSMRNGTITTAKTTVFHV